MICRNSSDGRSKREANKNAYILSGAFGDVPTPEDPKAGLGAAVSYFVTVGAHGWFTKMKKQFYLTTVPQDFLGAFGAKKPITSLLITSLLITSLIFSTDGILVSSRTRTNTSIAGGLTRNRSCFAE